MQKPYAVIQIQGKQELLSKGDKLVVDQIDAKPGDEIKISDVLLYADKDSVKVGKPILDKATVTLKVLEHQKAKKIRVATYKAKSRYRKVKGHRQAQTQLEVLSLKA